LLNGLRVHRTRVRSPGPDSAPMCARPARGNIAGMTEVRELTRQPRRNVFVRSPRRGGLTRVLTSMGATVLAEPGHGLSVTGMDACTIASAAAAHYIPIQELTPRSASPENTDLQTSPAR
jgi:ABC-2 type transport system ATP-binding protein